MTVRVIAGPTEEPVSLVEAKLHLRETLSAQDALITNLIKLARQQAEMRTRRALVQQTLELLLPEFPNDGEIELPRPPLIAVAWVKYTDTNGAIQTVDPATYQVDAYRAPALVKPVYGESWPSDVLASDFNAVQVRYDAGFYQPLASPTGEVPESIRQWMLVRIAQLYEHREAIITGTIVASIPRDYVDGLLDPYVVRHFR